MNMVSLSSVNESCLHEICLLQLILVDNAKITEFDVWNKNIKLTYLLWIFFGLSNTVRSDSG